MDILNEKEICAAETSITTERRAGAEEYHLWKSCPPTGISGQIIRTSTPLCAADPTCAALLATNGGVINGSTAGLIVSASNLYYNHAVSQLGPINPGDVIKCYPNCCGQCFEYLGIAWHYAGTNSPNIPIWVGKSNSCTGCDHLPILPTHPIYCKYCDGGYPIGQQTQGNQPCSSLGPGWIPQNTSFLTPCVPKPGGICCRNELGDTIMPIGPHCPPGYVQVPCKEDTPHHGVGGMYFEDGKRVFTAPSPKARYGVTNRVECGGSCTSNNDCERGCFCNGIPSGSCEAIPDWGGSASARYGSGGPCICRTYETQPDGSSKCIKWSPPGCGDAPFSVTDGGGLYAV